MTSPRNIGGHLNPVDALRPVDAITAAAFALVGLEVDRETANSMCWVTQTGAVTGAPSATTVDSKLQHRNSSAESWVDCAVTPGNAAVAITQITAANTLRKVNIDLTPYKRFVRAVTSVVHTAGTTPKIGLSQTFILDKFIET